MAVTEGILYECDGLCGTQHMVDEEAVWGRMSGAVTRLAMLPVGWYAVVAKAESGDPAEEGRFLVACGRECLGFIALREVGRGG